MIKKYLILQLTVIICTLSCSSSEETKQQAVPSHFVSIKNGHFSLDDKEFFPLTINFKVSMLHLDGKFYPAPYNGYYPERNFTSRNPDSCKNDLLKDFMWIKELGYNSMRIVGIGEEVIEDYSNGKLAVAACCNENNNQNTFELNESTYQEYYSALATVFKLAEQAGLKVILLVKLHPNYSTTETHFAKLAKHFSTTSTLMAYDIFNEPLYFDTLEREKIDIYELVKRWQKIKNDNAPNQLSTIGMTGVREVIEWDPNIMSVDFLSFHPYEYEPNQVMSEIYWYGKYVKKPWMIGETGIPADNDSVSYDAQKNFAEKTLNQTFNCGGIGYSWWQFRDVNWFDFHQDFLGVVNRAGSTQLPDGNIEYGEAKPLNDVIKGFNSKKEKTNCVKPDNYYNYSNSKTCRLIGKLVDSTGMPIEGGVVMAWNQYWSSSYHTVTKEDGSFELLGTFPFYHWMVSSTMHTMKRGECLPDTARFNESKIPTMNLGVIELDTLRLK